MNSQEFAIGMSPGKQGGARGGGRFYNNYNIYTLQKQLSTLS